MRCASPPDNSVAGWPSRRYPRPTSCNTDNDLLTVASSAKNSTASSTVRPSTSAIFLSLYLISNVFALYRVPPQTGQGAYTLGRKSSSTITKPSPSQFSHLPFPTLKENRP